MMVNLDCVVDAKDWMSTIIPSLHDHLKAHQFKFERNNLGQSKMFYKEWSSDEFWLPQGGLSLLPEGVCLCMQNCVSIYTVITRESYPKNIS